MPGIIIRSKTVFHFYTDANFCVSQCVIICDKELDDMKELLSMTVGEAYSKSLSSALAEEIWEFKNPGEPVDEKNREYISWRNSLPCFLECVHLADLDNLLVVFEMKTPISNKAIDVLLVGKSVNGENRILLVELKQWTGISTKYVNDDGKVYVSEVKAVRRHPLKQLQLYLNNLDYHHSGIQKARDSSTEIQVGMIAYLHNFINRETLYTDKYKRWEPLKQRIFAGGDDEKKRLVKILKRCFINSCETVLLEILKDYEAVLGDEGLEGLRKAYKNEASLKMKDDQQDIVDFVLEHLNEQKENPHKEIIVISGGPGTGKTIVGIRFILEYVNVFNSGKNDNRVIFCLPKSQTVKAMFDAACSVEEEYEKEYCCYLQEISVGQNLVVVDEAHRITNLEKTLDEVFEKGTKLLILLQDDHQMLRPGEQGTFEAFRQYADRRRIDFSPAAAEEKEVLTLVDEKRCDEKLLQGITKLFYDETNFGDATVDCLEVFGDLHDLEAWYESNAKSSKTKYILPFCWRWNSRNGSTKPDIEIGDFRKNWNPVDTDDQVIWMNDKKDDRAACIYTSQGLDMDNVAFIWWDDLVWDEVNKKWSSNPNVLNDPAFRCRKDMSTGLWQQTKWDWNSKSEILVPDGFSLTQDEMDLLIKNTYYVMLSRPRKNIAIWFKDAATKKHVLEVLGISSK